MTSTRRAFLQTSLASIPALALAAQDGKAMPAKKKLLIIGGTGFLGPAIVTTALARGHEVTLFNRGRTRTHLFPEVERIQGNRDPKRDEGHKDLEAAIAGGRRWDAVVDDVAYYPRPVLATAELLLKAIPHYVVISSISAYADNSKAGQDESAALATLKDETVETMGKNFENYGGLKVLCEKAVQKVYAKGATVVRPGYIVGPDDPTDRFTWWPVRHERGGEMLAPGTPDDPIQIIDVRDLGAWLVHLVEHETGGTFNACGPKKGWSMGGMLDACKAASGKDTQVTWVPADFLAKNGEDGEGSIPIWAPPSGKTLGFHRWSNQRALDAGLVLRDPVDTTKDTLTWWRGLPEERRGKPKAGLSEKAESELLRKWREAQGAK
jgi:2'-hydroxyisoflavone reductase